MSLQLSYTTHTIFKTTPKGEFTTPPPQEKITGDPHICFLPVVPTAGGAVRAPSPPAMPATGLQVTAIHPVFMSPPIAGLCGHQSGLSDQEPGPEDGSLTATDIKEQASQPSYRPSVSISILQEVKIQEVYCFHSPALPNAHSHLLSCRFLFSKGHGDMPTVSSTTHLRLHPLAYILQ